MDRLSRLIGMVEAIAVLRKMLEGRECECVEEVEYLLDCILDKIAEIDMAEFNVFIRPRSK